MHNAIVIAVPTRLLLMTISILQFTPLSKIGVYSLEAEIKTSSKPLALRRLYSPTASSSPKSDATLGAGNVDIQNLMMIYCTGPLLHAVQTQKLFEDSKEFVDMSIKKEYTPQMIIDDFEKLISKYAKQGSEHLSEQIPKLELQNFVSDHFGPVGKDLIQISPPDYDANRTPTLIAKIASPEYRLWATQIHELWGTLCRVRDPSVVSSYLTAPEITDIKNAHVFKRPLDGQNALILAGGRFHETYYWDSIWIVKGLLVSELYVTARCVVNNLLEYLHTYGFVMNGARLYYSTRSQPPMLSEMVRLVARKFRVDEEVKDLDLEYLEAATQLLEQEHAFWMKTHAYTNPKTGDVIPPHAVVIKKDGNVYTLNQYTSGASLPRPESYREDYNLSTSLFGQQTELNNASFADLYNNIRAIAESGWDFTSRYFKDHKSLSTINTRTIIPVELNAILYRMEKNMAFFYKALGNSAKVEEYEQHAEKRMEAMNAILWNAKASCWKDYNLETKGPSYIEYSAASDYIPIWAGLMDNSSEEEKLKVVESFSESGLLLEGGIATTTIRSGQQWDLPNGWAPIVSMLFEGLLRLNVANATTIAGKVAKRWIQNGHAAYQSTGFMFEKYNVEESGFSGHGGEYKPQTGFGWTNGVYLDLLTRYEKYYSDAT